MLLWKLYCPYSCYCVNCCEVVNCEFFVSSQKLEHRTQKLTVVINEYMGEGGEGIPVCEDVASVSVASVNLPS